MLRIFLCDANKEPLLFPTTSTTAMPANHLTNYDSLGQLIDKYNADLSAAEAKSYAVDRSLVSVRDAIAHGRLCSSEKLFPLTLYKFGKPNKSGAVPIQHVTLVTAAWLEAGRKLAYEGIQNVRQCGQVRGYGSFS